jgi:hypothetical protein
MADDRKPSDKSTAPPVERPKPNAPQAAASQRSVNANDNPVVSVEPVTSREIVAIVAWTALADLLIFRSLGFCGPAVFFALVPLVFSILQPKLMRRHFALLLAGLLAIVVGRLVWQGSSLAIFSAVALVIGLAMSAADATPLVMEGTSLAARCAIDGAGRLSEYSLPRRVHQSAQMHSNSLALLIPAAALIVFGSIFVFANPNLFSWVSSEMTWLSSLVLNWVQGISIFELPFCLAALLIGTGLMRPARPLPHVGPAGNKMEIVPGKEQSTWYPAFRNTLYTLISLFAVYLIFEFATLWKRDFPEGFYYAGYAHQGAAWLTFALALATVLLSLIFRQSMLRDPRLERVRKLAWIWSGLNLLLAVAVYNRLLIYVGYNGMTRMRTIGFFGITLVVIGFALVLYKIAKGRNFWWLVRAQLAALLLAVVTYSFFPADYVAQRYNVSCIQSGYLHPSVMIAVKPISDEGFFPLLKLTNAEDPIIREGTKALLAQRHENLRRGESQAKPLRHWTEFQGSSNRLTEALKDQQSSWQKYKDRALRDKTIKRFKDHAMQWY